MNNQVIKNEGLFRLLLAIVAIKHSSEYFREYLNSGNKKFWDKFVIQAGFFIQFSLIERDELLAKTYLKSIQKCSDDWEEMIDQADYTPNLRLNQENTLELLWDIKLQVEVISFKVISENKNITSLKEKLKNEYPESFDLLQTLEESL